jgi:tripartite-type tricarboxylate transporter receptor subunit TctC
MQMGGTVMSGIRTAARTLAIAAFGLAAITQPGLAQSYPSQNITMIVAFPAGGLADMIGRLVSTKIGERLKQNVVVDNRGGAGGNIAAKAVAGAAADGYTLLTTTSALAVAHTATKNKGFETSDLRPVAFVAYSPDVLAVHPSNPAKDLKEFIANAKQKSFSYGSAGIGTGPQIGAEYFFKDVAKVKYVHVPFKGGAPAITAALGGHVDSIVLTLPPVTAQIKNGKLRGLGVASATRNPAIPDVPTYGEMGYPNIEIGSWVAVFAPAKTPDAVVAKLNAEIIAGMKDKDALDALAKAGFAPVTKSLAESNSYFKSEIDRWGKMVTSVGFTN